MQKSNKKSVPPNFEHSSKDAPHMQYNYKHILKEERYLIDVFFNIKKKSISEIAKIWRKSKAIIYKEIKRNSVNGYYFYEKANDLAKNRTWHSHAMHINKYNKFIIFF